MPPKMSSDTIATIGIAPVGAVTISSVSPADQRLKNVIHMRAMNAAKGNDSKSSMPARTGLRGRRFGPGRSTSSAGMTSAWGAA